MKRPILPSRACVMEHAPAGSPNPYHNAASTLLFASELVSNQGTLFAREDGLVAVQFRLPLVKKKYKRSVPPFALFVPVLCVQG